MKIAMVTDSFYPSIGGSETAIKNLCLEFIRKGHRVKIYGLFEGVKSPDSNIEVIYISSKVKGIDLKCFYYPATSLCAYYGWNAAGIPAHEMRGVRGTDDLPILGFANLDQISGKIILLWRMQKRFWLFK